MTYPGTCALDVVDKTTGQHEVTFNENVQAMDCGALFSVNPRLSGGLLLTLYGGNWPNTDGTIAAITQRTLRLTASATNYIYADAAGSVFQVISAPTGWPGPLANSARALYQLTTDANVITASSTYLIGLGQIGPAGPDGIQGIAGVEIYLQRKVFNISLAASQDDQGMLHTTQGSVGSPIVPDSTSFTFALSRRFVNTGSAANAPASVYSAENHWFRGNAAGRGGFDISFRFGFDSSLTGNTTLRSFFGLRDVTPGVMANADPTGEINLIGVGAISGDSNLSWIRNDGSGAATQTAFATPSNFPMRSTTGSYELRFQCNANGSGITVTITHLDTGLSETQTFTTDIPANTTFLGYMQWVCTGSNTSNNGFLFMQAIGNSRY